RQMRDDVLHGPGPANARREPVGLSETVDGPEHHLVAIFENICDVHTVRLHLVVCCTSNVMMELRDPRAVTLPAVRTPYHPSLDGYAGLLGFAVSTTSTEHRPHHVVCSANVLGTTAPDDEREDLLHLLAGLGLLPLGPHVREIAQWNLEGDGKMVET